MARTHHYQFAHHFLPRIFFHDPVAFFERFTSCEKSKSGKKIKEKPLAGIWDIMGESIAKTDGKKAKLSSEGLKCELHKIKDDWVVFVITLPRPQEITEAFLVGLVLQRTKKKTALYFTLEYGCDMPKRMHTVFCEWIIKGRDRKHKNMGQGPEPAIPAFVNRIEQEILSQ